MRCSARSLNSDQTHHFTMVRVYPRIRPGPWTKFASHPIIAPLIQASNIHTQSIGSPLDTRKLVKRECAQRRACVRNLNLEGRRKEERSGVSRRSERAALRCRTLGTLQQHTKLFKYRRRPCPFQLPRTGRNTEEKYQTLLSEQTSQTLHSRLPGK